MSSDEARRHWRRLLDATTRGEHTEIQRYGETTAVVVPADWYRRTRDLLAAEMVARIPPHEENGHA